MGNVRALIGDSVFRNSLVILNIEEYCNGQNIPFKILLLLDNAPGHPTHLGDLHPNIQIKYLPPNSTSILQPMEQGAKATFKAHYLKITSSQAIEALENLTTLKEFWSNYNVLQGIKNISSRWQKVTPSCMSGIWKKISTRFEQNTSAIIPNIDQITDQIVKLGEQLNLDVGRDDINQLIAFEADNLTNEDLQAIEEQSVAKEHEVKKTQMMMGNP